MTQRIHILYLFIALLLFGAARPCNAQKVQIFGNVYGGGEKAQVVAGSEDSLLEHLVTDAQLHDGPGGLFNAETNHHYTTYVRLGDNVDIYGKVFGGGQGHEDSRGESAGRVIGQTDVVLRGATVWSELYGGGEMSDVRGNTLLHFIRGKAGHNAFGGGLGKLGKRDAYNNLVELTSSDVLPDNRYEPLASADVKKILYDSGNAYTAEFKDYTHLTTLTNNSGNTFVVFDGNEDEYTHYEFEKERRINRDGGGAIVKVNGLYYTESLQYDEENPSRLFSINHNIYGGGMTAANVDGNTYVHIRYGMVSKELMEYEGNSRDVKSVWSKVYKSIANAQFCVFGGGYGYHSEIKSDTYVTMDIAGSGTFRYINEFTDDFVRHKSIYPWDTNIGSVENIYRSADESVHSHGAPGRSAMDIIGGGYNGRVLGTTHVTVGGDVVVRKVYGGGYYASVGNTEVNMHSGIFERVYGGGMIGNVYGTATLNFGQQGLDEGTHESNLHLLVKDAVYGGNDVSGTVGTTEPGSHTNTLYGVTYNVFDPVDDASHGVRLNIYGGLVLGDVYGAGNGNHPGYTNPDYMEFDLSQHPGENYRRVRKAGIKDFTDLSTPGDYAYVYKYRPRTARVIMNIQGNAGTDFNDDPQVDKVRIWGRTFGGGNSCNVGVWNGTKDDDAEVFSETEGTSWHPGDNFTGGGTIQINIGSHVQLGNRNDSHETPNGLFMGCNGEHLVTQHTDIELAKYYHQYYDATTNKYWPGFPVYKDNGSTPISRTAGRLAFKAFLNNILTKSDNVGLTIKDLDTETAARDVWMSNFVGGGYRGSMQAATATGHFHYTLPKGVTIGHSVVGGAFNAHVIYRIYATVSEGDLKGHKYDETGGHYNYLTKADGLTSKEENSTNYDYIKKLYDESGNVTGLLRYNFDGGMLAMSSGMNAEDNTENTRIHAIRNIGGADFTGQTKDDSQSYSNNKNLALVKLELHNMMEPEVSTDAHGVKTIHGGIVYGGCFSTGFVEGDTWVDYRSTLSPLCTDKDFYDASNVALYELVDKMDTYNALKVFGAGFGADTHSMGDVYVRILHDEDGDSPFIYNIFGGGNQGTVGGNTNVYYNAGKQGNLLGSLYGGGYKGTIDGNTFLELAGGKIVNAYGGSREADIKGSAHVWAYDCAARPWGADVTHPQEAHLIISNLYGGNDISGTISGTTRATWTETAYNTSQYGSSNHLAENFNTYTQICGTVLAGRGFPLIGNLYAGGNGEQYEATYAGIDKANRPARPDVAKAMLEIGGGTTFYAFGGGNHATVTNNTSIFTNCHSSVQFAEHEFTDDYQVAIVKNTFLHDKVRGYKWEGRKLIMDNYHVLNLFGGNNVAEMSIQPTWNLNDGRLGNVFSGGNLGNMTHPDGITIHTESSNIYIDNLFGGCRMADVVPTGSGSTDWALEDSYGATTNVYGGYIGNVYGGNDVSGHVMHGTHVNISGAVNGNVYGAGNGNYIYQWDKNVTQVTECHEEGELFYKVPPKAGLGGENATDTQKLITINEWRPSVKKTSILVAGAEGPSHNGTDDKVAFVRGNVFCGGKASTVEDVDFESHETHSFTKFQVGSYATINGIFIGSDGADFSQNQFIAKFEMKNHFDMGATPVFSSGDETYVSTADQSYYPNLLSLYMRAVEMSARPKNNIFGGGGTLKSVYIGTACGGGNRGSMTTKETVRVTLPEDITIFGRVVAGCYDANVVYETSCGQVIANGGYTRPLTSGTVKLDYDIKAKFSPMFMSVPDSETGSNEMGDDFLEARTKSFLYPNYSGADHQGDQYEQGCNIYGGCFESGEILGDVTLNVYSNLIEEPMKNANVYGKTDRSRLEKTIINEVPAFNIYGGGFGMNSHVWGNVTINMDKVGANHPGAANIFGAGRSGYVIGNASINLRDGIIYRHVVGGADAGYLYGSSQIAVGYPEYYTCNTDNTYSLDRADKSEDNVAKTNKDESKPIVQEIKLLQGDVISKTVYDMLPDDSKSSFELKPYPTDPAEAPSWSNRTIHVGGGIYGGGYALVTGSTVYAGDRTVRRYTEEYCPKNPTTGTHVSGSVGYGGNATIMVADDPANASSGTADHITISTLVPTAKTGMSSTLGYFTQGTTTGNNALGDPEYKWESQPDVAPVGGKTYYELTGKGGIFGDGHLSVVEGFRSADIRRYGYATYTPQNPKLLNTLQRLDVASLTDCCIMLQGARDFTTTSPDATIYSVSRVRELQMHSSISNDASLSAGTSGGSGTVDHVHDVVRSRNYLGFYNNVRYLGALQSDVAFGNARFDRSGVKQSESYQTYKQTIISDNPNYATDPDQYNAFRTRNLGTARNMIGINNGYSLRVQNVYTTSENKEDFFYGPVVGVFEAKLLSLIPGEGGGYIYADNVHDVNTQFLNTSGNFVFAGVDANDQFIVDDCFPTKFSGNASTIDGHYWYVEGNKYWFHTTITGYTADDAPKTFNMDNVDNIVTLFDTKKDTKVKLKSITWEHDHSPGCTCDIAKSTKKGEYGDDTADAYAFSLSVSKSNTYNTGGGYLPLLSRSNVNADGTADATDLTYDAHDNGKDFPLLAIQLVDNVKNNGEGYYDEHLKEPCTAKIVLEAENNAQTYTYTVYLNVLYLKGPSVTGKVFIDNCALPGEFIRAHVKDLDIETNESMPVTKTYWRLVKNPDNNSSPTIELDRRNTTEVDNSIVEFTALHKYNGWFLQYVVEAVGQEYAVDIVNDKLVYVPSEDGKFRNVVVHNYHDMSYVNTYRDNSVMALRPDAGSRIYIKDETGLRDFIEYLNYSKRTDGRTPFDIPEGMEGVNVILQKDIKLTSKLPDIEQAFAGNFHGDGYHIDLGEHGSTFLGDNLTGKVYNLGVIGGNIAQQSLASAQIVNCYDKRTPESELRYGKTAYDLSHYFTEANDASERSNYVHNYYEAGSPEYGLDYQYAYINYPEDEWGRTWGLRTQHEPHYNSSETYHDTDHTPDALRRNVVTAAVPDDPNTPDFDESTPAVYGSLTTPLNDGVEAYAQAFEAGYANDYLFFGQHLDLTNADSYPMHINAVATGDAIYDYKGGNRVFGVAGYHGSNNDVGFHYNRDAWALHPDLTAIDFTTPRAEGDNAKTVPDRFSVDSNRDHCSSYDNETFGHVTQNLLVYNDGEAVFAYRETLDSPEAEVRYHNIVKSLPAAYATDYLHLVDKQDFNAPIGFTVNSRAWYERKPQTYRNADGGYAGSTAWEGICLPFQDIDKVSGEPQEVNGESHENVLSHFYGEVTQPMIDNPALNDRTLHHEYWLTGLVAADGGKATFARPSNTGDTGNFYITDYNGADLIYENFYYRHLPHYEDYYDSRDDDGGGADAVGSHVKSWYEEPHLFSNYVRQHSATPYLCAFPGDDFYEFSLEDQTITFEKVGTSAIAVTDVDAATYGTTTVGTHQHVGTFHRVPAGTHRLGINAAGNAFDVVSGYILPFRTYMTTSAGSPRRIVIRGYDDDDNDDDNDDTTIGDATEPTLIIYGEGTTIVVESNYDTELRVYTPAGRLMRVLQVENGINRYENFLPNVYVVGGKKLLLQ